MQQSQNGVDFNFGQDYRANNRKSCCQSNRTTPNPKELLKPLVEKAHHGTSIELNGKHLAICSELAHVEKKGGAPLTENETRYGFQLVLASV
jgi:hypothetical protein